jgi:hypothetical protein
MKIVFTVCNRHQIRHALVLSESLLRHNPDYLFIIGWTDQEPPIGLPDWIQVIRINELIDTPWQDMCHRYYDFELMAASKPFFARFILHQIPDCTELIYLAPCTWILGSMSSVLNPNVFFQVTPHRLQPITAPHDLDDKAILNIGMYHAGGWALHPNGEEMKLLNWWCKRTTDRAFFDLCHGMCLDQLWMNYLSVLFEGVGTIRNSGWHYGLHAVHGNHLSKMEGTLYRVNQHPLISIDFSGIECYHPVWTDHTAIADKTDLWPELLKKYRTELDKHIVPTYGTGSIPYGKVSVIKSYRKQRKKAVGFLDRIIDKIETYDLTYN